MKTNELRIGNYLFAKGTEVIRFTSFFGLCNIESYPERYTPIPLNEEWLLKFGFNIKERIWFSKKTNIAWIRFEVSIKDKRCILFNTKKFEFCDILFPKYVHQLQNLYFALTGEELAIK